MPKVYVRDAGHHWPLCVRGLSEAPLAAGVLDDEGRRGALSCGLVLRATLGGLQVLAGAADQASYQVMEQVTSKEHVDPGVTAAVQTAQQHSDDKGHV